MAEDLHPKAVEAQVILKALGLDVAQQNKISAYTLLALCSLGPDDAWASATSASKRVSRGVRDLVADVYGVLYKENTRETFRRRVLHQFVQGGVASHNPDDPTLAVNSSKNHYALTAEALAAIRSFGSADWAEKSVSFRAQADEVRKRYARERDLERIPLHLPDGSVVELSPGLHNEVQRAVVERFAEQFAKGAQLLYLGDTESKYIVNEEAAMAALNIPIGKGTKLPDIVLYQPENNWLYLIEVVTSHGPISTGRKTSLMQLLKDCSAGLVYVTAFPDFKEFKKYSTEIAWDTEVWIMELPDHMIHFNGDRFLGPH